MSVVSVRLEPADEVWLRKRKLSPGTFARLAVHEKIRRQEIDDARKWLDENSFKAEVDSVEFFRRDRKSH